MEYLTALVFLLLYYIRPQDWMAGMTGMNIVRPMVVIWLAGILSSRSRPAVQGIFRTPHDWAMLAYYIYVSWTSPNMTETMKAFLPHVAFYILTVRSLTTWSRLEGYFKFWNLMLLGVAAMAVASLYGLDLTHAKDVTARMAGRLSLGTWLHNNPNALAHSVVVALPLGYVLYFWKKGASGRLLLYPFMLALAGYCVYETKSKGAFLVGGMLCVLIFVVGRPKFVQVLTIAAAATIGISALSFLPRMEQMGDLRADEGVQGRLMIWETARRVTETRSNGEGWKQFQGEIIWEGKLEKKATHSSYIQVGADLGITGMFMYLLPLWLSIRTFLGSAKITQSNDQKERCRRAGFLLLIAYAVSGWMINREYHTEYFLLVAVAAALQRLLLAEQQAYAAANTEEEEEASDAEPALAALIRQGKEMWNRISVMDIGVAAAMTWGVLFTWDYVLEHL